MQSNQLPDMTGVSTTHVFDIKGLIIFYKFIFAENVTSMYTHVHKVVLQTSETEAAAKAAAANK